MKKFIYGVLLLHSLGAFADKPANCSYWISFLKPTCQRLHDVWNKGNYELYFSGYAWHNRYTYSPEKIPRYNELAWGGGIGKGILNEKGEYYGLNAMAFLDSHKNLEPLVGYLYLRTAELVPKVRVGGGFTVFVTSRPDIYNSIPFPGLLPWFSLTLNNRVSLCATYIPGNGNSGNVLYVFAKYNF